MKLIDVILIFLIFVVLLFINNCDEINHGEDAQFIKIHFYYGFGNELNTFEKYYTKDLVLDGKIKIHFWLTSEEQEKILEKVITIGFFNFPETINNDSTRVRIDPDPGEQFLLIQYRNHIHGTSWFLPLPSDSPYTVPLTELTNFIIELIKKKPAYQALPPARGGYL